MYPNGTNCFYMHSGRGAPGDDIWAQVEFQGYRLIDGTSYADDQAIALDGLNGDSTGWQSFACTPGFTNNTAEFILETSYQPIGSTGCYYILPHFSDLTPYFNVYTYTSAGEIKGEVAPYDLAELRSYLFPAGSTPYGASNATPTGWASETAFSVNDGTSQ